MKKLLLLLCLPLLFGCTNHSSQESEVSLGEVLTEAKLTQFHKLEFKKPEGWFDITDIDLKDILDDFDISEEKISYMLKRSNKSLMVSKFTKYDMEYHIGPIPVITVVLRENPYTNDVEFKEFLEQSIKEQKSFFTNYKLDVDINDVKLDGINGFHFIASFELPVENEMIETKSWFYVIPAGSFYYQINFVAPESDNCYQLYDNLSKSIKFKK